MKRHGAVPVLDPTVMIMAVERRAACAVHSVLIINGSALEASQRHQRFERGARRELGLNRAVQQWMVGIIYNLFPVLGLNPHGEFVGIECRPAGYRQHLAITRIEGHNRPFSAV